MLTGKTAPLQPMALPPKLFVIWDGQVQVYDLAGAQSLGRPSSTSRPDISIPTKVVSRNHGSFLTVGGSTYYTDTASTNGTICNAVALPTAVRRLLTDGDILRIHGKDDPMGTLDVVMIYSTGYLSDMEALWDQLPLDHYIEQIPVGRKGAIALQHSSVSREHAVFYRADARWAIVDLGSRNGVFVNNQRIPHPVYLRPMDVVRIGLYHFLFTGSMLVYQSDSQSDEASTIPTRKVMPKRGTRFGGDLGAAVDGISPAKVW